MDLSISQIFTTFRHLFRTQTCQDRAMKRYLKIFLSALILCSVAVGCGLQKRVSSTPTLDKIQKRGTLLVGTTGDYRPLSYKEPETGEYWGFGIDMAGEIAGALGVSVSYVPTSWPTLSADVQTPELFDFAIGGITITDARLQSMDMSEGYLCNGKTILCRKEEADKYKSLEDLDKPEVRVMVNPGGLNEKFARENLPSCSPGDGQSGRPQREVRPGEPSVMYAYRLREERRNPLQGGCGGGRRDDNGNHGSALVCPERHPSCSPASGHTLHPGADWCPHAERAGGSSEEGQCEDSGNEVRRKTQGPS